MNKFSYSLEPLQERLIATITSDKELDNHQLDKALQEEPLIQFINQVIIDSFEQLVSDIHIEPFEHSCRIRYRQHGVLRTVVELPVILAKRITSRIKVMANLDISESRMPQDGQIRFNGNDIRISTCPVILGEKCVLRLLHSHNSLPEMSHTGMNKQEEEYFCRTLSQPQGMILVTGPTGSGKTVTLYAGLNYLNNSSKNIVTVEDPVEIRFCGINQTNINHKAGLSFATTLRALLRQDPDIIMLGEIRDEETAKTAVQAAQTGHLVLATLHSNNASEANLRLTGMGISAAHLAGTIKLVISQRLLRVLCNNCKEITNPHRQNFPEITHARQNIIYEAKGCDQCINGYIGRTAIFEFLPYQPPISSDEISPYQLNKKINVISLREAGVLKVFSGITSPSELNRVLENEV